MKKIIIIIQESEGKGKIEINQEGWPDNDRIPIAESIGYLEIAKQTLLNERK